MNEGIRMMEETRQVLAIAAGFRTRLENPDNPFALLAQFRVRQGTQKELEAAFAAAESITRKEPGMLAYDLNRDPESDTGYVLYERWDGMDCLEAHLKQPHVATLVRQMNRVLDGDVEFRLLVPATGRGVSQHTAIRR